MGHVSTSGALLYILLMILLAWRSRVDVERLIGTGTKVIVEIWRIRAGVDRA